MLSSAIAILHIFDFVADSQCTFPSIFSLSSCIERVTFICVRLMTPLHVAADKSHTDVMDVLLKHNAKVNALDRLGQTALHRFVP